MDVQFRHLEREIECQPMPPQFRDTKVRVYCNDCSAKTTVKYHWLGLKCAVCVQLWRIRAIHANVSSSCDSFNTAQIQILQDPEVVLPPTRGRALEVPERPRLRPAVSVSALGGNRRSLYTHPSRNARSESPGVRNRLLSSSSSGSTDSMDTDEEEYDDDDDDDEDDVEFWGGESPSNRTRPLLPSAQRTRRRETRRSDREQGGDDEDDANEFDDDDDDDRNDDDDDDVNDDDDDADDDDASTSDDWETDADADGDDEDGDPMEIFGHR